MDLLGDEPTRRLRGVPVLLLWLADVESGVAQVPSRLADFRLAFCPELSLSGHLLAN